MPMQKVIGVMLELFGFQIIGIFQMDKITTVRKCQVIPHPDRTIGPTEKLTRYCIEAKIYV
jgi:hypothetical protein